MRTNFPEKTKFVEYSKLFFYSHLFVYTYQEFQHLFGIDLLYRKKLDFSFKLMNVLNIADIYVTEKFTKKYKDGENDYFAKILKILPLPIPSGVL